MFKHALLVFAFLGLSAPLYGQTAAIQNHCFLGGTAAKTSGLASSNYLNGIIPHCTVTVYLTGTQNLATIYSSASSAPLSNPFTANTLSSVDPGGWVFWAAVNQGYDIVMTGGDPPNTYPQPVTLIDQFPAAQFSGGSGCAIGTALHIAYFASTNNCTSDPLFIDHGTDVNAVGLEYNGNGAVLTASSGGGYFFTSSTDRVGGMGAVPSTFEVALEDAKSNASAGIIELATNTTGEASGTIDLTTASGAGHISGLINISTNGTGLSSNNIDISASGTNDGNSGQVQIFGSGGIFLGAGGSIPVQFGSAALFFTNGKALFDPSTLLSGDNFTYGFPRFTGTFVLYSGALTASHCLEVNSTGNGIIDAGAPCGSGSGAVNSVTNSDGTLTISPTTGAVVASLALGHANTWTAMQTLSGLTLSGITGSTQCLHVSTAGVVSGTGSDCGSGGATAWSAITNPAANLALTMGADTSSFTYNAATGASDLFALTDTLNNTGTGILFHAHTASGSTETPFQADANGVGWNVGSDGSLTSVGSTVAATMDWGQGTAPGAAPSTSIQMYAPATVTGYNLVLPGAVPTAGNTFLSCTAASPSVCTWVAGGGSSGVSSFTGDGTILNNASSTGAVTATLATHPASVVLMGPLTGTAAPTFRAPVYYEVGAWQHDTQDNYIFNANNYSWWPLPAGANDNYFGPGSMSSAFVGHGISGFSVDNVIAGHGACGLCTTISNSTLLGANALGAFVSEGGGIEDGTFTCIGAESCLNDTTGSEMVAVGHAAYQGVGETSGVVVGNHIQNVTGGFHNVYIGADIVGAAWGASQFFSGTGDVVVGGGGFDMAIPATNATFTSTGLTMLGGSSGGCMFANSYNTGVGYQAFTTSYNAGTAITCPATLPSGQFNVVVWAGMPTSENGHAGAGGSLTTGASNLMIGGKSVNGPFGVTGRNVTSGNSNVLVGAGAGAAITTASDNVAIGDDALPASTTSDNSTAVGAFALLAQTTGTGNSAVGYHACDSITTQNNNTCVGYSATAVGPNATVMGNGASAGNNGTVYGQAATDHGTTNSAVFGYLASANANNATAVGIAASATQANAIALGEGSVASAANAAEIGTGTCATASTLCFLGTPVALTNAEVVTFSATPTFSASIAVSRIVLTGNITSFTLGAGADGQNKTLCFKQGAGPFTVTPPAGVHGFFTVGTTNADWSCQTFTYDNTDAIWLATGPGVVNQ